MQYLLMIYQNEADYAKIDAATSKKMLEEYGSFTQSIIQSGHFKAGDGLQPTTTATTVRVRDGKTLTTDGPFAGSCCGGHPVLCRMSGETWRGSRHPCLTPTVCRRAASGPMIGNLLYHARLEAPT